MASAFLLHSIETMEAGVFKVKAGLNVTQVERPITFSGFDGKGQMVRLLLKCAYMCITDLLA